IIILGKSADVVFEIVLVVSNKESAPGLAWARGEGVPTACVDHRAYASREAFDGAVEAALLAARTELVAHAGFMRIQSDSFVQRWAGRQLNIHPSLLPSFKGLKPHQQALEAGVRISGCTVHFVTAELDGGPIVAQAAVPVIEGDTAETLADRILVVEHRLYPQALAHVATGRARLVGNRVQLDCDSDAPVDGALYSPTAPA
ncbi:MAG TPA: phosphoribosylglycinamide formyltransferase, partial [Hyphomicrobiaceae bacterium]|nr:phosphoribosylglycinamide formyltransferase [Hyphomicrobiaceae bacterium]